MSNFKHVGYIPVDQLAGLVAELEGHPSLWDQYPLRTELLKHVGGATSQCSDILLHYTDIAKPDHLECVEYPAFFALQGCRAFVFWFAQTMQRVRIGKVVVTKLKPGMRIDPHIDSLSFSTYYDRFHLSLKDCPGTDFRCGTDHHHPNPGDIFWFDNTQEHEVFNGGTEERWTMIIDLKKTIAHTAPYEPLEFVNAPTDGGDIIVRVKAP